MLYYNENGEEKGWGDGGPFLKFKGSPDIVASYIEVFSGI